MDSNNSKYTPSLERMQLYRNAETFPPMTLNNVI